MKTCLASLRLLAVLTVLTGIAYPALVWAVGAAWFPHQATGSLLVRHGRVVGSALLAQATADPRYFHPRPSAGDFLAVPSAGGNAGWTSAQLAAAVAARRADAGGGDVPAELLTDSGSGLDPDLSPEAVRSQLDRVAAARRLSPAQRTALDEVIAGLTAGGQLAPRRVNVLRLNLALDERFPAP